MFNFSRLSSRIKTNDGFRGCVYKDQLGNLTIGYGHLIKSKDIFSVKKRDSKRILSGVFNNDLEKAILDFKKNYHYMILPDNIQEVIVEMIFQLGSMGVQKFRNMWKALKEDPPNYFEAHVQMLDSRWAKQTPARAVEMSEQMQNAE